MGAEEWSGVLFTEYKDIRMIRVCFMIAATLIALAL